MSGCSMESVGRRDIQLSLGFKDAGIFYLCREWNMNNTGSPHQNKTILEKDKAEIVFPGKRGNTTGCL